MSEQRVSLPACMAIVLEHGDLPVLVIHHVLLHARFVLDGLRGLDHASTLPYVCQRSDGGVFRCDTVLLEISTELRSHAELCAAVFVGLVLAGQSEYHQMGLSCKAQAYILQIAYLQINMWHTMTVVILHRVITTGSAKFHGAKLFGIRYKYLVHIMCWIMPIVLTTILSILDDDVFHENIWGTCSGTPLLDEFSESKGLPPRTCQQLFDYAVGKWTLDADAEKLAPDSASDIWTNRYCAKAGVFEVPDATDEWDGTGDLGTGDPFNTDDGAEKHTVSTATCIYVPSEVNGIGWCSIHSKHRIFKAFFFNLPQLIVVSFYAQYYYYIHQIVDPDKVGDVSGALGATKISASGRSGMMSTKEALMKQAREGAAEQQRLYMLVYMMSFLVNTLMQLFGDNMASGTISSANLTLQALLVTPQGLLVGLIYMRNTKSLFSAYSQAFINWSNSRNPDRAAAYKEKKLKMKMKREKLQAARAEKLARLKQSKKGAALPKIKNVLWVIWNVSLMMPVAVWVWTPMEFLGEFVNTNSQMLVGLVIWGFALVFPFYFFSVGRLHETDCLKTWTFTNPERCVMTDDGVCLDDNTTCEYQYFYVAQLFLIFIVVLSSTGVYMNRYAHHLLFTEGPIRREGFLSRIGMGYRFSSTRNSMSAFTGFLEFYQTYGLTWSASQMPSRYQGQNVMDQAQAQMEEEAVANATGTSEDIDAYVANNTFVDQHNSSNWDMNMSETAYFLRTQPHETYLKANLPYPDPRTPAGGCDDNPDVACCNQMGTGLCKELFTFWACVAAVGGWTFLYCLPHVINTTTVGNRQLSLNLQEAYRKYLWFMSGAGFLTVLKALIKVQFCLPFGSFKLAASQFGETEGPEVSLTDAYIQCWEPQHLRMVAISLGCLCIFFPSASLTCLFRYDEDDDRGCFGEKKEGTNPYEKGYRSGGCNAGGEDLRWCHLWRRIEYIVKVCWVTMGYRLSQYGNISAFALLSGSALIAYVNAKMEPSNLRQFNRWKFTIHCSNVWTTMTCLMANFMEWETILAHYVILFFGWLIILAAIIYFERKKISEDVFLKPADTAETLELCKKEAVTQRRVIAYAQGVEKWDTHQRIVRLIRLTEHEQMAVSRIAFRTMATLAYYDQMTLQNSFFLRLTCTNPTTMSTFYPIMTSEDDEQRNAAVQFMTVLLQMNIGNKVAKPCTFHEMVMVYDDGGQEGDGLGNGQGLTLPKHLPSREKNEIIQSLCDYATSDIPRDHAFDACALIMEMCNADSNKLIFVADTMLPMLSSWMREGSMLEQHLAVHLVAMVSNRFDAAQKVIDSDAAEASMELFKVVYSVFGKFTDSSKNDKFVMDEDMPSNVKLSGRRLPKGLKREFLIPALKERDPNNPDDFVVEGSEDEPEDVAEEFELNPEQQLKIQGDILHFCMQTIVELAGASRAVGRRQLLEMGALDTITKCLDANVLFEDRGLYGRFGKDDTSEVMKVRTTLMHEACSACHGFLAGRFGMHDMELDEEFDKPYKTLEAWKAEMAEDKDFESTKSFDGLGAVQRRKLHIVCAFLQLPHNSVGGIGNRSVVAGPVKNPDAPAPASKAEAVKEGAKSALSAVGGAIKGAVEKKVQPDWMQDDEDDIYKWCWAQTASASGANSNTMADQMISMHASETGLVSPVSQSD